MSRLLEDGHKIELIISDEELNMAAKSPEEAAEYRFITRDGHIFGYYSGWKLGYELGLIPNKDDTIEICINNLVREKLYVSINGRTFLIRRANVFITEENRATLQLLDLLEHLEYFLRSDSEPVIDMIKAFAKKNRVRRSDVEQYKKYFPEEAYKNYLWLFTKRNMMGLILSQVC